MHFSTIFAATALVGATFAEDITVSVGLKGNATALVFKPDTITAKVGDVVWFHFWPKAHSVAQASFAKPCEPLDGGLWSGFVPTTDTENAAQTTFMYNVTNATAPVWLYCSQGKHCQAGMVAVINPPSSGNRTLEAFKEAAALASNNTSPEVAAGQGGMLMNGTSMSNSTQPGAASTLQINGLAFSGVLGMLAYMFM